jgi:hypothetical protein
VQMRLTKILTIILITISTFDSKAQNLTDKGLSGETYFYSSFYRLGSYNKERPTFFLEQNINYRFNKRFSAGVGLGIDLYPALLAFPLFIDVKYHFKIMSLPFNLTQSLGRNIKLTDTFFTSYRYMGDLSLTIKLKKMNINPRIGYNFLWEKYGGKNLGFFAGIGIEYKLSLSNH